MLGTYEYPDFPMTSEKYGVQPGQHIPGTVLHAYLTDYAKHFGVYERMQFDTKVISVEPVGDEGWILHATTGQATKEIKTKKLILATGLTSKPFIPVLPGKESFEAPLFHTKEFKQNADTLKTTQNAVVIGGAKSAWDVAYAYAEAGAQVDMIIRRSGRGPVWMAPAYVTPLKKWLEKLVSTRFLTWMSPCVWGEEDGYTKSRSFLHTTAVGRFMVGNFWKILGGDVIALNKYDSHPETAKLKPWDPAFYVGTALSIHNYPTSFFDMVREGKIRVHHDEVSKLGPKTVHLSSGEILKADVLVCATGWTKESALEFTNGSEQKIGFNSPLTELETLVPKADEEILSRFPMLKTQPPRVAELEKTLGQRHGTPIRMFKFMVPPAMMEQRTLAFAGMLSCLSTSTAATVQGLWISAFFDNKLDRLPSQEEIDYETVLHSQYVKWRHPIGYGPQFPDFVFDTVPYFDMILKDLNLNIYRKPSAMAEMSDPYGPEDYAGLVDEWKLAHTKV